jgi:hypothetical protein
VQVSTAPRLTHQAVAEALMDLQLLFQRSLVGTQKRIAQALFEHVEVLGPARVWLHPSDEAVALGWATAMTGEFTAHLRQSGRGERGSASLTHLRFRPRFVLENVTMPPMVWPVVEQKAG